MSIHAPRLYTECMDFKSVIRNLTLVLAGASFSLAALAQWQWTDKDGHRVFSDRSPPAEVQDKDILKRPAGSIRPTFPPPADAGTPAVTGQAVSPPVAKASAPKLSGKDAALEAKKKKAEDEEAAKKKAEEAKVAQAKTENCERAKNNMAVLQSGMRMSSVNANGEREIYDDSKRAVESKRTQDQIDASCK